MFLKLTQALLVAGMVLSSSKVYASFVDTDWQVIGDGKATLQESTGLEWLKLNYTSNSTFTDIVSELGAGGAFEGWRLPTISEVRNVAAEIADNNAVVNNLDTEMYRRAISYQSVWLRDWFDLMGRSWSVSGDRTRGFGLVQDEQGDIVLFGGVRRHQWSTAEWFANDEDNTYSDTTPDPEYGVFLVSDGGTTLSSINNPQLNISNPNAPINQVPIGGIGIAGLGLILMMRRR